MRAKIEVSLIRQFSAMAASTANSTACWFSTGSAPGRPRQTGQTLVFGGSPNCVEQPQKILVVVSSWTWTSSPITGSYLDCGATGASGVVAISSIIAASAWDQAVRASFDRVTVNYFPPGAAAFDGVNGISKYISSVPLLSRTPVR